MPDREKVIKELESQLDDLTKYADADEVLALTQGQAKDILALLKEQEPRVMTRLEIEQSKGRIVWFEDDQFNSYALVDGIDQRNSWVWLSTVGNMCLQQRRDCENYGKRWRCWTQKPTQEQMKAVKWDD